MHGLAGIKAINDWAASAECKRIVGADLSKIEERVTAHQAREVKYEGHHPDGSGVQKHSAGPLYPGVFYQKGEADYIMIGTVTVRVPSYAMAEQLVAEARQIKATEIAANATIQPLDVCLASAARLHGLEVETFREEH